MDQEYFGMDDEQYGLVMETLLKVNKQKNVRIEEWEMDNQIYIFKDCCINLNFLKNISP